MASERRSQPLERDRSSASIAGSLDRFERGFNLPMMVQYKRKPITLSRGSLS